jgi:hypothetical protein
MKRIILLLIGCLFVFDLYGQSDKKNLIGTHISLGTGTYNFSFPAGWKSGFRGYQTKYYGNAGVDYARTFLKRWDICTGFEYTYYHIYGLNGGQRIKNDFPLVSIPVQLKYRFLKYIYLNGGIYFHLLGKSRDDFWAQDENGEYKKLPHTGMKFGYGFGVGYEHEFNSGILLSINPNIRWNGTGKLKGLTDEAFTYTYTLFQGGVSIGVGYKF